MVRPSSHVARSRRGSSTMPAVVAIAGLALLAGAVAWFRMPGEVPPVAETTPPAAVEQIVETPKQPIVGEEAVAAVAEPATKVAEKAAGPRIADQVAAHLAAGEFGPAIDLAIVQRPAEATRLLNQIVDAQLKVNDFDGALAAIRLIPQGADRDAAHSRRHEQMTLAGGSGADFTQLIELIQNETQGEWLEVDGQGGTMTEYETGVRVDPNGMLATLTRAELDGRLQELGIQARVADLNEDMAQASELRMVSLVRLEQEVARRIKAGQPVVETMKNLAGLSQIKYIFVYPEANEVVIAGPAQGWRYNENGLAVGVENGRPTMQLDDLVTVIRTFSDSGRGIFGCSINPREAGLKAVKDYVEATSNRPLRAGAGVRNWANTLQRKLGQQDVETYGVPADSRVARVIVEADYRMKLIGIGKMEGSSNIPSIFDLFTKEEQTSGKLDALRWWLSMKYDTVLHSPDRNVFEIQGSSVLCRSENQFLTDEGQRVQTGKSDATNRQFAANFTEHYEDLAQRDIVFADLQNVFDSALVAALLNNERLGDRAGWNLGVFGTDGAYRPATYEPAQVVDSVVNHRVYNGKDVVVQVAGGVQANVRGALKSDTALQSVARLGSVAATAKAPALPAGRWWWDASK